jgi:hypothetical protein
MYQRLAAIEDVDLLLGAPKDPTAGLSSVKDIVACPTQESSKAWSLHCMINASGF